MSRAGHGSPPRLSRPERKRLTMVPARDAFAGSRVAIRLPVVVDAEVTAACAPDRLLASLRCASDRAYRRFTLSVAYLVPPSAVPSQVNRGTDCCPGMQWGVRPVGQDAEMPERWRRDLTQATLKFAAGDDHARSQVSSTWSVRFTRGTEIYVFNLEAGGQRAHISFHKDGRCHYKVEDPSAKRRSRKVSEWEMPAPIEETGILRLATVIIPHRGLVVPSGFTGPDAETVLIQPPPEYRQLEVDLLLEPGAVPSNAWPGQTSAQRTALVGRFSLYTESDQNGFLHATVVSTVRSEGPASRLLSTTSIHVPKGSAAPVNPRTVLFQMAEVDSQQLPVLTEMPVGHWS